MRLSLVVTTLFIFIMLLLTGESSSAQIGGSVHTDTVMTIPSNLVNGDSVTVTSTTTFTGGPVFYGQTTLYHLDDVRVKGDTDFGTSISLTDPTFELGVSNSMTLRVIRIPIISISTDSVLRWNISDSSDSVLAEGEMNSNQLIHMQEQGSLMIVIGSIQSDDIKNDNKYASGVSLSSGTYKVSISQNSELDLQAKASNTYAGLYAYDDGILQTEYPQLYLMGGSHSERVNTIGGVASTSFTVSTGTSYVLAYYGDGELNFSPSHDFKKIEVQSNSVLSVFMNEYQGNPGSTITLVANVDDSETPVEGASVQFSILNNGILTPIGTATTSSSGIAQLSYSADVDTGSHLVFAEATYNSQYGITNSSMTLTQPFASWSNLDGSASYDSEGSGNSIFSVSGTIKTPGGNPIADTPVDIYANSSYLITLLSDSNGNFIHSYSDNIAVGVYSDYFSSNIADGFWNATPITFDLLISKGLLFANTDNLAVEFINQPIYIVGNITNLADEKVVSTIYLDKETSPSIWTLVDSTISDTFTFQLETLSAGSYNYRIRVDQSSNYVSVTQPVSVSIGPSNGHISRGGLPTTFDINYHQSFDLSVYVLQENLSPIENASVQITVWDPTIGQNIIIVTGLTGSNGLVTLSWVPHDFYISYPGQSFPMIYSATHNDFVITNLQVFFTLIESDISVSLIENSWTYDTSTTIEFDTIDEFGYMVNQDTQFDVTIEGIIYTLTINSQGKGAIIHQFANTGSASMTVTTTNPNPFPYNSYSDIFSYVVNKGDYIIAGSNEVTERGNDYPFSVSITDHNGNSLSNPITASLWLFDVTWIKLGEVSSTGDFTIPVDLVLNEGTYTIEWRVPGNSLYNAASELYSLTIENSLTEIIFTSVPVSYNFNDDSKNREVTILIQVPILDEPVSNQFVSIDFVSIDDSYSWFLQTNSSGYISLILPQQPNTGNYTLTASFAGNSNYITSTSVTNLDVIGIDTILTWNVAPSDEYYADDQLISVHAEDILGNDLVGFTVDLQIGLDTYTVVTNSTGDAAFSISMIYEGTVDIQVILNPKDGWNGDTLNTSIEIVKNQLEITSEINSVLYSPSNNMQDIDISILINSTNDPYLTNIKLELYWFNPSSSQFEFIDIYYTDLIGYVSLTLSFPEIDASNSYLLSWIASDSDFLTEQLDTAYSVLPMPLDVIITYPMGNYLQSTPVDYVIRDVEGRLITGLDIYMSYTEIVILWSDSDMTSFGTATINFVSPSTGDLSVYYLISHPNDNYISQEGNLIITILPTVTTLEYSLEDIQGTIWLYTEVKDTSDNVVLEGTIIVEKWEGNWVTIKTITLTQTSSTTIDMYDDNMQFRVRYTSNSHYSSSELTFQLYKRGITVIPDIFEMELNSHLTLYIELQGNSSLSGYSVDILIFDPVPSQWINYDTVYSINGIINDTIPIDLPIGSYQLRLVIPEQGWYYEFDHTYTLTINFNEVTFEIDQTQFIQGINNDIAVTINASTSDAVNSVQLDLYIMEGINKIHLGMVITNSSGTGVVSFIPAQQYGFYTFIVESQQTVQINASSYEFEGMIGFTINATFYTLDPIDFDEGGVIAIQILDHSGQPISNSNLDIFYSLYDSVSQSFVDTTFLLSGMTNSTGIIEMNIAFNILQSIKIQLSISFSDPLIIGSSIFYMDFNIEKISPVIEYQINDEGITKQATIIVYIKNLRDEDITGTISWEMKSENQVLILEGNGDLILINDQYQFNFTIPAIYIGSYQIFIDYHDTQTIQKYLDTSIFFDFGWSKSNADIDILNNEISYSESQQASFVIYDALDGHTLGNILVNLEINDTSYQGTTNTLGIVVFQLDLIPDNYDSILRISNSQFVVDKLITFEIQVNKGWMPLSLSPPSNYTSIPEIVTMEFIDPLFDELSEKDYQVVLYRDGSLVDDTTWEITEGGELLVLPRYTSNSALSTQSNHQSYLYPGEYTIEITRYHPYYENETYLKDFTVEALFINFDYDIDDINGTIYLNILYDDPEVVDVEFVVYLENRQLEETLTFVNTSKILIPWEEGRIAILIQGTGYISGYYSGDDDIPHNSTTSTTSISNSTRTGKQNGFDNFVNVNSIQTMGGIMIVATASAGPIRNYLKKRK